MSTQERAGPLTSPLPAALGRYSVVGHLASGGMAEILLGKLVGPGGFERPVVIKRILPHLARQPSFVKMFLDEARLIARIRHSNVIQVYDLVHQGDELYQVLEYLDGESTVGLMRRLRVRGERLPWELGAYLVSEASAGLAAAHELLDDDGHRLRVVHRDVSPENIFVTYDGAVKLLDFGVAKARNRLAQTQTGELKGKLAYMSPEQVAGQPVDERTDLFALGIVLHELTTGKRLFVRSSDAATVKAISDATIPAPSIGQPGYPALLEAICMRALQREPADRYASAAELRRDLERFLRHRPAEEPPQRVLRNLMHRAFGDRIAEKQDMLRRLAVSSGPIQLPALDVDVEVEISVLTFAEGARGKRRRRAWAVLALAAVGMGLAAVGGWRLVRGPIASVEPRPTLGTVRAPAASQAPDPRPARVRIEVVTAPSGAQVSVDGDERGVTPITFEQPRGDQPLQLVLRKSGFATVTRTIQPTVSQILQVTLVRTGAHAPSKRKPWLHRFD